MNDFEIFAIAGLGLGLAGYLLFTGSGNKLLMRWLGHTDLKRQT